MEELDKILSKLPFTSDFYGSRRWKMDIFVWRRERSENITTNCVLQLLAIWYLFFFNLTIM